MTGTENNTIESSFARAPDLLRHLYGSVNTKSCRQNPSTWSPVKSTDRQYALSFYCSAFIDLKHMQMTCSGGVRHNLNLSWLAWGLTWTGLDRADTRLEHVSVHLCFLYTCKGMTKSSLTFKKECPSKHLIFSYILSLCYFSSCREHIRDGLIRERSSPFTRVNISLTQSLALLIRIWNVKCCWSVEKWTRVRVCFSDDEIPSLAAWCWAGRHGLLVLLFSGSSLFALFLLKLDYVF